MNILVISGFPEPSGSEYYRARIPFKVLPRYGHACRVIPMTMADPPVMAWADVLVFVAAFARAADQWNELVYQCRLAKKLIVVDLDDDLFQRSPDPYLNELNRLNAEHRTRIVRSADLVTVTTEALRQVVLEFNPNVVVLPNAIDPVLWQGTS